MKVADLQPGAFGLFDGPTDVDDASFADFQQNILDEDEFQGGNVEYKDDFPFSDVRSTTKEGSSKVSPTKVMDFHDDFSSQLPDFSPVAHKIEENTKTTNCNSFPQDGKTWGDFYESDELKELQSSDNHCGVHESEWVEPKILFQNEVEETPGSDEINSGSMNGPEHVAFEKKKGDDWWGQCSSECNSEYELDSHGFPTHPVRRDVSDEKKPNDSSFVVEDHSIRSRSTNWKTSEEKPSCLGGNCFSLPIFVSDNLEEDQSTGKAKNTAETCKSPSHWDRMVEKLHMGATLKNNLLQLQSSIMVCHEPNEPIVDLSMMEGENAAGEGNKHNGIESSNSEGEAKNNGKTMLNESLASWKQFSSSVLSLSQEILSIPSDVSTPRRKTATFIGFSSKTATTGWDSKLDLCIDHYQVSAFQALMSSLKGSAEVTDLSIFRGWDESSERPRTAEDLSLLFKVIRSLPNLEKLNLANFLIEDIHFVELSQWKNDNLASIRIHLCKGALTERLLRVLAGLPALKEVTLEMNESFPFHFLLNSSTLESVTILGDGFDIDNLHAMEIVHKLPKNGTLKVLTIEPPLKASTFKFIASALGKNSGIEHFKFSLMPGTVADTNNSIGELSRTLADNNTLITLTNINYSSVQVKDRTCDEVIKALSENYVLEHFLVFEEPSWFSAKKNRILKENKGESDSIIPQMYQYVESLAKSAASSVTGGFPSGKSI